MRQFKKNRLAVCSIFFVGTLFLIAISAPFLANNRPIVLMGAFRGLYKQNFEEWKLGAHPELMSRLQAFLDSSGAPSPEFPARLNTVRVKLEYMASQLPRDSARALTNYLGDYDKAVQGAQAGDRALAAQQTSKLEADFQEITSRFDPERVEFEQKLSFPVLEMLTPQEWVASEKGL